MRGRFLVCLWLTLLQFEGMDGIMASCLDSWYLEATADFSRQLLVAQGLLGKYLRLCCDSGLAV